jgi:hypothetical protein
VIPVPLIALGAIRVTRAIRLRWTDRPGRQAPSEPAHRHTTTATSRRVLLPSLRLLVQRRRQAIPAHPGAQPDWSPAAWLAEVQGDPALITLTQHAALDHAALDVVTAGLEDFGVAVDAVLARLLADDPLTLARLRISAATDEWDATDLHARLAAEDQAACTQ